MNIRVASTRNAAFLYYRAFLAEPVLAEPLSPKQLDELSNGKTDPDMTIYFQRMKPVLDLMREAGTKPYCDWGFETIDSSETGIGMVLAQTEGLSDLAISHFEYECLTMSNGVSGDDIIATFNLAKHLKETQPPFNLPLTEHLAYAISLKTIDTVSKYSRRLSPTGREEINSWLAANNAVLTRNADRSALTEIDLLNMELNEFEKEHSGRLDTNDLDDFLARFDFSPEDISVQDRTDSRRELAVVRGSLSVLRKIVVRFKTDDPAKFEQLQKQYNWFIEEKDPAAFLLKDYEQQWQRQYRLREQFRLFQTGKRG